jgi:DNA-binding transcriptional MerR regulator
MSDKMRIGQVHARLRERFHDLELSKIRYYEDMGLVTPSRTAKGYRLYSERDVVCLEEALRMVCEEGLPLKIVQQRLIMGGFLSPLPLAPSTKRAARVSGRLNGVVAPVPTTPATEPLVFTPSHATQSPMAHAVTEAFADASLTASELLGASGLSPQGFNALVQAGVLSNGDDPETGAYNGVSLVVARRCAMLLAAGVDVRLIQGLKRTVDREMDLVNEITRSARQVASRDGGTARADVSNAAVLVASVRDALREHAVRDLPVR